MSTTEERPVIAAKILDSATIVETAERVGREELAPRAAITDLGMAPPRENFAALAQAGLFGLTVPARFGGLEADAITRLRVLETLSRYCAATPFLFTQHIGVCASIASGGSALAPRILPGLGTGELLAGVGASQLRRAGVPQMRARKTVGGYIIDGSVPWASGYGLMTHIALGAVDEAGLPLFFWVPFREAEGISFGEVQDMVVMRSAFTVPLFCKELFVGDDALVGDDSGGYWRAQHGGALSGPVAFLLGIGSACLAGLRVALARSDGSSQNAYAAQLERDLDAYRTRFHDYTKRFVEGDRNDVVLDALLKIRVEVSAFVLRLAAIAIAAEGGRAHLRDNPAQRRLREASFFLTGTVNQSMREALILGL